MILIDSRIGSKHLVKHLHPAQLTTLTFADAAFTGNGPGETYLVGIEVKTIGDALNCIDTGRFAGHQLPGLLQTYHVVYLLVEGEARMDKQGVLCVPRRGGLEAISKGRRYFLWRDLENWLTSMEQQGQVHLRRSRNKTETAAHIQSLYHWWQKPWEGHHSMQVFDTSRVMPGSKMALQKPSLVKRVAKELTGVGWIRASAVAKRFGSVLEMCLADEKEWAGVDGIGKGISKRVVEEIHGKQG